MVRKEKTDVLEIKANMRVLSSLVQGGRSENRGLNTVRVSMMVSVLFMHVSECLMYKCGTGFPSTACVWKL